VQNKTDSEGAGFALKLWLPDGSPTDPFVQGMDLIAVRGEVRFCFGRIPYGCAEECFVLITVSMSV
jgi:hypothetical protein